MTESPLPPTVDEVTLRLTEFVNAEVMAAACPIGPDDGFEAAGVDSLALLRVLVFAEATYGVWVADEDLVDEYVGSVRALARYVASKAGRRG